MKCGCRLRMWCDYHSGGQSDHSTSREGSARTGFYISQFKGTNSVSLSSLRKSTKTSQQERTSSCVFLEEYEKTVHDGGVLISP